MTEMLSGRTDWATVQRTLADATASWQDLDGFHLSSLPATAPLTSIVWAWRHVEGSTQAWVIRLDGEAAFVAAAQVPADQWRELVPWEAREGQVRQARFADPELSVDELRMRAWTEPASGAGVPVTFICHIKG